MNEFSLIDRYFKTLTPQRSDVVLGVGDDGACVEVPKDHHLVITTDTLVSGVHFYPESSPFAIGYKSVMVNVSDIAAMAALPAWASLSLTLPKMDEPWLEEFSKGLKTALDKHQISLIGGDMTCGPLSITITMHGLVPMNGMVRRSGARVGDGIYVSGELGLAALAVKLFNDKTADPIANPELFQALYFPKARVDYVECLQKFATSVIDISDGLSADLLHICQSSGVGACLNLESVPLHPLVIKQGKEGMDLALGGGDDYQLCFTIPKGREEEFLSFLQQNDLKAWWIGQIEEEAGLRVKSGQSKPSVYQARGYSHF